MRAVLYAAMDSNPAAASRLAAGLLAKVRACGGFRDSSPNFVGREAIANATAAFDAEGFILGEDGSLSPKLLTSLRGVQLTDALAAYARRAQKGAQDAALVAGTGKDLLEPTAAHALETLQGRYPTGANFQGLLGMAFVALELAVPEIPEQPGEPPVKAMEAFDVTDTITLTESVAMVVVSFVSASDTVTLSETVALTKINLINVSDSVTLSESVAVNLPVSIAVSDTITISEQVQVQLPQLFINVSDSVTISEIVTVIIVTAVSYKEILHRGMYRGMFRHMR